MPDIETVWARIVAHQERTFHQVEGGEFTYTVSGNVLRPDRTNRNIPKSDFAKALPLAPFSSTTQVNRLGVQGPSYVFAILMDARIRQADW